MKSLTCFIDRDFETTEEVPSIPGAFHVKEPAIGIYSQLARRRDSNQQRQRSYNSQALTRIIKEIFPSVAKERIENEFRSGKSPSTILNDLAEESSSFVTDNEPCCTVACKDQSYFIPQTHRLEQQQSTPASRDC